MITTSKSATATTWIFAFGGGLLQVALACLGPLVFTIALSGLVNAPDSTAWQVLDYLIFGLFGTLAALSVSVWIPDAALSGRWIWAVPVVLLAFALVWDMHLQIFDSPQLIFFGRGESGWITLFLTLPAWSCCWYSATMAWRRRRRNRSLMETARAT